MPFTCLSSGDISTNKSDQNCVPPCSLHSSRPRQTGQIIKFKSILTGANLDGEKPKYSKVRVQEKFIEIFNVSSESLSSKGCIWENTEGYGQVSQTNTLENNTAALLKERTDTANI